MSRLSLNYGYCLGFTLFSCCNIIIIAKTNIKGGKQHRVYELDEEGNRLLDENGNYIFNAVPTTDWGSPETLEYWREQWAAMCNAKFEEKGIGERIFD